MFMCSTLALKLKMMSRKSWTLISEVMAVMQLLRLLLHGSGHQYEWEEGLSIFEIDPAPCEPWMIDYLKEVTKSASKPAKKKPPKPSENPNTVKKSGTGDSYADILRNGAGKA